MPSPYGSVPDAPMMMAPPTTLRTPLYPLPATSLPMTASLQFDGNLAPINLDAPVQAPTRYFNMQAPGVASSTAFLSTEMAKNEVEKKSKGRETLKEKGTKKKSKKRDDGSSSMRKANEGSILQEEDSIMT